MFATYYSQFTVVYPILAYHISSMWLHFLRHVRSKLRALYRSLLFCPSREHSFAFWQVVCARFHWLCCCVKGPCFFILPTSLKHSLHGLHSHHLLQSSVYSAWTSEIWPHLLRIPQCLAQYLHTPEVDSAVRTPTSHGWKAYGLLLSPWPRNEVIKWRFSFWFLYCGMVKCSSVLAECIVSTFMVTELVQTDAARVDVPCMANL